MRSPIIALTVILLAVFTAAMRFFEGWGIQRDVYIVCLVMLVAAVIAGTAILLTLLQNGSAQKKDANGRDQTS